MWLDLTYAGYNAIAHARRGMKTYRRENHLCTHAKADLGVGLWGLKIFKKKPCIFKILI